MGFLGLIPADKVTASYDPEKQILTLIAEGKVKKYTTGIHFVRDCHFVGGLKYDLEGWTGPIGKGWEPYVCEQEIHIHFPSVISSGKDIIIATANDSKGEVVTVRWLGYADGEPASIPSVTDLNLTDKKIPEQPPVTMTCPNEMTVIYGVPFPIVSGAESNKYYSCTVKFDSNYLTMINAANEEGLIIWTYMPITIGITQVVVTTTLPPPIVGSVQKWYTIEIIGRSAASIPKSITDGSDSAAPAEPLSFIGRVYMAMRIVQHFWPDAELWWVTANLPAGARPPTKNPNELYQLQAAFNVDKGTVIIRSDGWQFWGNPKFYPYKIFGNVIVPFPVKLDLVPAYRLMVEKGWGDEINGCVLRHPLGPKCEPWDEQPYYIFQLPDGIEVYVGMDGSVWPPPVKGEEA
jgi:hypothetical protein